VDVRVNACDCACTHVECVRVCVYACAYTDIQTCMHACIRHCFAPVRIRLRTRSVFFSRLHTRTVSHVVGEEGRYSFSETHAAARVVVARGRADVCRHAHANLEKQASTLIAANGIRRGVSDIGCRELARGRAR